MLPAPMIPIFISSPALFRPWRRHSGTDTTTHVFPDAETMVVDSTKFSYFKTEGRETLDAGGEAHIKSDHDRREGSRDCACCTRALSAGRLRGRVDGRDG